MGKFADLTGLRFGRLTVVSRGKTVKRPGNRGTLTYWICKCDCGKTKEVLSSDLKKGATTSCGCYQRQRSKESNMTHGLSETRIYNIWSHMKERCTNQNAIDFYRYGGVGVIVCEEWTASFEAFRDWSLKNGYRDDLTIDRIDGTRGYEPSNCRWATTEQQNNNRKNNIIVEYDGKRMTLGQLSKTVGVNYCKLWRCIKNGMTTESAVQYARGDSL
jgi:hypothetical protein